VGPKRHSAWEDVFVEQQQLCDISAALAEVWVWSHSSYSDGDDSRLFSAIDYTVANYFVLLSTF